MSERRAVKRECRRQSIEVDFVYATVRASPNNDGIDISAAIMSWAMIIPIAIAVASARSSWTVFMIC